jgi:hypothetical protein
MSRLRFLALLPLLLLAGCFPIELDVRDGKLLIPREEGFFVFDPAAGKAAKVAGPEGGKPVFARFAPDGKEVLTVSKADEGFKTLFRFVIRPIGGDGKGREVYKAENTAYVLYSPDGANLGIVQMSEKEDPAFKDKVPEFYLVPAKGGAAKKLGDKVGVLFRWFGDSKRVLVFELAKKDEQSRYHGNLSVLDVTTGKATPLAAAVVTQTFFFDLSPDGKKALFTAYATDKPGTDLTKTKEFGTRLFELDVAAGTVRKIDKEASYAIYSRDGKQVLLGTAPEGFGLDSVKLEVADAGLTKFTTVAPDAYKKALDFGGGTTFPGWLDDKTVFYFVQRSVYGTEGKSLGLMTVGTDGKGRRALQPLIDTEVAKDEK